MCFSLSFAKFIFRTTFLDNTSNITQAPQCFSIIYSYTLIEDNLLSKKYIDIENFFVIYRKNMNERPASFKRLHPISVQTKTAELE